MRTLARLAALGLVAAVLSVPVSTPTATAASVQVAMLGHSFSPATVTVVQNGTVTWNNGSGVDHNATSRQGFFATPTASSGSATRTFPHAGSFGYYCTVHGTTMSGVVRVPLRAPASAANGFTLRWSSASSTPSNRGFDVQKQAPGTTTWTALKTNTQTRAVFLNPARNGTWRFRARTDNRSNGKSSGWSPVRAVSVS